MYFISRYFHWIAMSEMTFKGYKLFVLLMFYCCYTEVNLFLGMLAAWHPSISRSVYHLTEIVYSNPSSRNVIYQA